MKVSLKIPSADSYGHTLNPYYSKPGGTIDDAFNYVKTWHRQLKPGTKITIEVE